MFSNRKSIVTFCILLITSLVYLFFPKNSSAQLNTNSWVPDLQMNDAIASQYGFVKNGNIYSIGGANSSTFNSGMYSHVQSNGSISSWSNLSNRPNVYWHSGANQNNYVYILGGANSSRVNINNVYFAELESNGDITSWQDTSALPLPLSLGGSFIYNNRIYFAGGSTNGENSSSSRSEIYMANINTDGTLGTWVIAGYLPHNMLGFGLIESNGYLIVLGGKTNGENYLNEVQKASIDQITGNVSGWNKLESLPDPVYRSGVTKVQNIIFSAGGYHSQPTFTLLDKVNFTEIDSMGNISPWNSSTNRLILPKCCMSLVSNDDQLYELGGWTGNYTNEVNRTSVIGINFPTETPTTTPTPTNTPIPTATPTPTATATPIYPVLSVPSLKQYSVPWKNKIYDHTKSTIEEFGCALTSAVMVLQYHGHIILPDTLNNWLKNQNDGYLRNGLLNWLAISRYTKINDSSNSPTLEYKRLEANNENLDNELESGRPAILKEDGHFVVATGKNSTTYLINDPGYPNRNTLDSYSNNFLSINSYTPTHSDLSYMMFVVDEDINLTLKDEEQNIINGISYIEEPIKSIKDQNKLSGSKLKILIFEKPDNGQYELSLSGPKGSYQLDSYLYDTNGKLNKNTFSGKIINNETDQFNISYESKIKIKKEKENKHYWNWEFFKKFKKWL